jgi:Flp pilus assembly pilin Flp
MKNRFMLGLHSDSVMPPATWGDTFSADSDIQVDQPILCDYAGVRDLSCGENLIGVGEEVSVAAGPSRSDSFFRSHTLRDLFKDERGQDLIEYGVLAAFLSVVALAIVKLIGLLIVPLYEVIQAAFTA